MEKTTFEKELNFQKEWELKPKWKGISHFNEMMLQEFAPEEEWDQITFNRLYDVIFYVSQAVPYYKNIFSKINFDAKKFSNFEQLKTIPILEREHLQSHFEALQTTQYPDGERYGGMTKTSGSSGQPVVVRYCLSSYLTYPLIKQREYRWFRFSPGESFASIRPADEIQKRNNGEYYKKGMTLETDAWPLVGQYFKTGPFYAFIHTNPIEEQKKWLEQYQPHYLLSQAANLELLALNVKEQCQTEYLKGILSISQQMTSEMREQIESSLRAPVYQNYGLNELGLVATRCPEGGRYHIHSEYYFIEIVDEEGQDCKPGESGRLLVTSLINRAMPLLRYDTGDIATASDGPCSCGRTLPTFFDIKGRYRRIAGLPPGTWDYWCSIQGALSQMPKELAMPLSRYQLHQFKDGTFELRLQTKGDLQKAFYDKVKYWWENTEEKESLELNILIVDEIPRGPGIKLENFTSDFLPPPCERS